MFYEYDLVIPAATPELSPVSLEMPMTPGIVHAVSIQFRAGAQFRAKLAIKRGLHQIFPTNPDGFLAGDFFPIEFTTWTLLEGPPFQLEAYGWSPDATYNHTVTMRFAVDLESDLRPPDVNRGILTRISNLLFGGPRVG